MELEARAPRPRIAVVHNARVLSERELATVRAALRLWAETPAHLIPERCYVEVNGAPGLISDDQVEWLLRELAASTDVVVTARPTVMV